MKKLVILLSILLIASPVFAADVWEEGAGNDVISGGDSPADIDTLLDAASTEPLGRLLQNFREGAEIEYDTASQVTVAAGEIAVQDSTGNVVAFLSNSSSTNVTFADIDTGSEASSTTYYIYAYCNDPTSDIDFDLAISTSSSSPSGISYYCRLGSFYNDSDSNITAITNDNYTNITISTGTIAHGETIPLPSGYAEEECSWMVSVNDIDAEGNNKINELECNANASRVVTCRAHALYTHDSSTDDYGWKTGTANYIIIGVK